MSTKKNDPLGEAIKDYYYNKKSDAEITVHCDISEDDVIPVKYLFRGEEDLPQLEKIALNSCKGSTLDVGAGAGCHTVILKEKGFDIKAIDTSEGAVDVMKARGLNAIVEDFYNEKEKFDTVLMLMNGIGLVSYLSELDRFFTQIKSLLKPGGQLILDSSDIKYMFQEEDGSMYVDLCKEYYGEVYYQMEYNGIEGEKFSWLFLDFDNLKAAAFKNGFECEKLIEDVHFNYLVRVSLK